VLEEISVKFDLKQRLTFLSKPCPTFVAIFLNMSKLFAEIALDIVVYLLMNLIYYINFRWVYGIVLSLFMNLGYLKRSVNFKWLYDIVFSTLKNLNYLMRN
jgi:hypothetical protein